ncbi:hypothetical protein FGO68_gene10602 [Halteria grandinella]|uniref:Uncharacterized protein n=1 Tax=Halteria grandinella TaxID=5974 RepID=A0A8J8NWS9_HALGN|nr:hypothetical protein FGO68_gene10602 [Halteria grandinella]
MMNDIKMNNLQELTISMKGQKNYAFYNKLLTLTKDNIQELQIIANHESFKTLDGKWIRKENLADAIEGSKSITSFRADKDFYLLPREIQVLATLPKLVKLSVDWFDADAMQELLEREFTRALQNLTNLDLMLSVPCPEKAFKGTHKSLIHLKYAYTSKQKGNQLKLDQTLAIIEGKKYGFKFTTLFENVKAFQDQCPKTVLFVPRLDWPWYKE